MSSPQTSACALYLAEVVGYLGKRFQGGDLSADSLFFPFGFLKNFIEV